MSSRVASSIASISKILFPYACSALCILMINNSEQALWQERDNESYCKLDSKLQVSIESYDLCCNVAPGEVRTSQIGGSSEDRRCF